MDEPTYRSGPAPTFGWMRRPEFDARGIWVWEKPNGELHSHREGQIPTVIVMCRGRDRWSRVEGGVWR